MPMLPVFDRARTDVHSAWQCLADLQLATSLGLPCSASVRWESRCLSTASM